MQQVISTAIAETPEFVKEKIDTATTCVEAWLMCFKCMVCCVSPDVLNVHVSLPLLLPLLLI